MDEHSDFGVVFTLQIGNLVDLFLQFLANFLDAVDDAVEFVTTDHDESFRALTVGDVETTAMGLSESSCDRAAFSNKLATKLGGNNKSHAVLLVHLLALTLAVVELGRSSFGHGRLDLGGYFWMSGIWMASGLGTAVGNQGTYRLEGSKRTRG